MRAWALFGGSRAVPGSLHPSHPELYEGGGAEAERIFLCAILYTQLHAIAMCNPCVYNHTLLRTVNNYNAQYVYFGYVIKSVQLNTRVNVPFTRDYVRVHR